MGGLFLTVLNMSVGFSVNRTGREDIAENEWPSLAENDASSNENTYVDLGKNNYFVDDSSRLSEIIFHTGSGQIFMSVQGDDNYSGVFYLYDVLNAAAPVQELIVTATDKEETIVMFEGLSTDKDYRIKTDNIDTLAFFGFSDAAPKQVTPLTPEQAPPPEAAASAEALPTWREDYADIRDLMSGLEFSNGEVSFFLPHGYPAELFNFRITAGTGDNYVTLFECYTGTLEPAVRYFIPIDKQNIDNISIAVGESGSDKYRVHPVYSDLLTKLVKLQNSQLPEPDERDIAEACDAMLIWLERWMTPEGRAPGYLPVSSLVSIAPVDAQNETRRDYLINAMKNGSNVDAENVIVFECDIDLSQSEGSVGAELSGENGHFKGSAIMVRDLFDGGDGTLQTGEWYLSVIGSY